MSTHRPANPTLSALRPDKQSSSGYAIADRESQARVYIAADNRLLRETLARILAKKIEVVAAAPCSDETLLLALASNANVILIHSASSWIHELLSEARRIPNVSVVAIGMANDEQEFLRAVRSGVAGYILDSADTEEIICAVKSVAIGEGYCPPKFYRALFSAIAAQGNHWPSYSAKREFGLSRREQQLLPLIAAGHTNKEIAEQLCISEQTVKNHVYRILRKLGTNDRLGAVEVCRYEGLPV